MRTASLRFVAMAALALAAAAPASAAQQKVPFVGCAGKGIADLSAAPTGGPKAVAVAAATASPLAYYQSAEGLGALAPKGWKCFSFSGTSGASLVIAATEDPSAAFDAPLTGNAVVLTNYVGDTSGRFAVAQYAARLFPQVEKSFIARVIAEGIEPKESFPFGPYPADKLTYKTQRLVEFVTPANSDGLGDSSLLAKNASPISGMAKIVDSADGPQFYLLTVRLPADQAALAAAIVEAGE